MHILFCIFVIMVAVTNGTHFNFLFPRFIFISQIIRQLHLTFPTGTSFLNFCHGITFGLLYETLFIKPLTEFANVCLPVDVCSLSRFSGHLAGADNFEQSGSF